MISFEKLSMASEILISTLWFISQVDETQYNLAKIGSLTNLQTLGLSNNNLSVLPAKIGALTNLCIL